MLALDNKKKLRYARHLAEMCSRRAALLGLLAAGATSVTGFVGSPFCTSVWRGGSGVPATRLDAGLDARHRPTHIGVAAPQAPRSRKLRLGMHALRMCPQHALCMCISAYITEACLAS